MHSVRLGLLLCAFLALPVVSSAQEAVLTGTVSDSTGGVLPGVTVTAVHEATGNRFVAITDESGRYRLPVRVGGYVITSALQGFATVTQANVQLRAATRSSSAAAATRCSGRSPADRPH
jgi:hypothetical protein